MKDNSKQEFDHEFFYVALERAIDLIAELKEKEPNSIFHLYTNMNNETVSIHEINNLDVCKVILINGRDVNISVEKEIEQCKK